VKRLRKIKVTDKEPEFHRKIYFAAVVHTRAICFKPCHDFGPSIYLCT